jgi:hypothetical protein
LYLLRPREPCKSGHACEAVGKTFPSTSTARRTAHHTLEAPDTAPVVSVVVLLFVVIIVLLTIAVFTALCVRSI